MADLGLLGSGGAKKRPLDVEGGRRRLIYFLSHSYKVEIGIIGTGDVGKLVAREFANAGFKVNCCDLPAKTEQLQKELADPNISVLEDGIAVSRNSDITFYLVETENIEKVVAQCGPHTKRGATVSAGTSVMTPAVKAFDKYLPGDVSIINWHWLFGPSIRPQGQNTVLVNYKSTPESYRTTLQTFEAIGARIIELPTFKEHDKITADTQVMTHLGSLATGTGFRNMGGFPWENPKYVSGIDNVKILLCLRIYAGKAHVYSGLATMNPFAAEQAGQYAKSVTELFGMMIQDDENAFRERIGAAAKFVFGNGESPILLSNWTMAEFGFGLPSDKRKPNSHLSLLGMLDAWHQLGINPYNNMICQTPLYRLRLGIVEYLCKNQELLEESVNAALTDKSIRRDDLEFHAAVREWSAIIRNGDTHAYQAKFEETRQFFKDRLPEGMSKSNELIRKLARTEGKERSKQR